MDVVPLPEWKREEVVGCVRQVIVRVLSVGEVAGEFARVP